MPKSWLILLSRFLAIAVAFMYPGAKVLAQNITLDGSLGTSGTLTGPNYTVPQSLGQTVGNNLFHSFDKFNLNSNEAAIFQSNPNIQNILSRVTGGNQSVIDGLISTQSGVNLFFINPSGIIFGKNASLDVGGSFVASTANALQFGNLGYFSATEKNVPSSLLTINPSALLLNQINQNARIQNNSIAPFSGKDLVGSDVVGLRVPDGKSLLLVGGNVSMDGGRLNAFGGRVELGGLTAPGSVNLLFDGNNFRLGFPENVSRASVSLTNQAILSVQAAGGGDITVNARDLEILKGSIIYAGILPGLGTPETVAGDITLNATGKIAIDGSFTGVVNAVFENALGQGGNIRINSDSLSLANGGQLVVTTFGQGNAGSAIINTSKYVSLDGGDGSGLVSGIFNDLQETGVGKTGGISINTDSLFVTNGAEISSSTYGKGNAGDITIYANNVSFKGIRVTGGRKISSGAFSNVQTDAEGNGGKIQITTDSLLVADDAELDVGVFGQGNGGNIVIDARGAVSFDKGNIFSNIEEKSSVGRGGDIYISSENISFINGAEIQTSTNGKGDAGNVTITARNKISFDGFGTSEFAVGRFPSGIFSTVNENAEGRGGDIRLDAELLSITNGAQLTTSTFGLGDAGNFTINARNAILIQGFGNNEFGSSLFTIVDEIAKGKGGDIEINTELLYLKEGAQLVALTRGQGDAGNIRINAKNTVTVSGTNQEMGSPSGLITSTGSNSTGKGGNINVDTNIFRISDGALFDTRTRNDRTGGDIKVNTNIFEALNGGQLTTTTLSNGSAGKITVNATDKVIISGSDPNFSDRIARFPDRFKNLSANSGLFVSSTGLGTTGDIEINSPKITLDNQGKLNADSVSGNGGNINLNSDLLLLRRGSKISTTAGSDRFGGDGGNININSTFIVAVSSEDSDISANAFNGRGGNVKIRRNQGILGITARPQEFPTTSDITASSKNGVQGEISINQPDTDPSRGLIELPTNLVDASQQIAQGCTPRNQQTVSRFISIGRGGLPENPYEPLRKRAVINNWVTLPNNRSQQAREIKEEVTTTVTPTAIVEAQGLVVNSRGEVELVAQVSGGNFHNSSQQTAFSCNAATSR